jgi:hypothetical protein
MKESTAFMLATLCLVPTAVMAQSPAGTAIPQDQAPALAPNDPNAPTIVMPAPEPGKNTGALNPDTPDPTKNTPGAESKN